MLGKILCNNSEFYNIMGVENDLLKLIYNLIQTCILNKNKLNVCFS